MVGAGLELSTLFNRMIHVSGDSAADDHALPGRGELRQAIG